MSSEWDLDHYRIAPFVSDQFDDQPAYIIDFTKHLKPQFALSKELANSPNGRPMLATYTYEGTVYAERRWEFTDMPVPQGGTVLVNKKVILNYYKTDGTLSPDRILENKNYNLNSLSDLALIYSDRVQARQTIVDEINAFVNAVFASAGMTDAQVAAMVQFVWNESVMERDDYVDLGTTGYADYLANADLTDPNRQWLLTEFDPAAPGVTLADYIAARITTMVANGS